MKRRTLQDSNQQSPQVLLPPSQFWSKNLQQDLHNTSFLDRSWCDEYPFNIHEIEAECG
jgi:hypothetical protein